jgi:hypothetical protein
MARKYTTPLLRHHSGRRESVEPSGAQLRT